MAAYDLLGMGCVAVDDRLYVSTLPQPDTKTAIVRHERHCGGQALVALVAAARLGAQVAYAGTLGTDPDSLFVIEHCRQEGIDLRYLRQRPEVCPIRAWVIVDQSRGTRTIFYDLHDAVGAELDWPPEDAIRSARVLLIDQFGIEGMCRAARIARSAGVPVVADLERDDWPGFRELLKQVDHLIVNRTFAERLTGKNDVSAVLERLWTGDRQAVVVTDGAAGCWYRAIGEGSLTRHHPAFAVVTPDSTGCGDVFHGAYAAALAWGRDTVERIRLASAAAALKAGEQAIPDRAAVEVFLARQ